MDVDCFDHSLVQRAQVGECGAFNVLVRKYRHRIMKITLRYTRNNADAEDAVQETFIKAFRALHRFRGEAAFSSWLYRIAVNSAKTALALRARHSNVFVSNCDEKDDPALALSELATPEALALTEEICAAMNAAIDALSDEQRTVVVLREFHGLSYSQVAHEMSCPIGTVRSRVSRAREAIDQRLRCFFDDGSARARQRRAIRPRGNTQVTWPMREERIELVG
jgi:RNA polymerase sigma-70 factor (ECF subfamily)